ncbi:hypothetical protein PMI0292 [Proteus mirabilis HI4320]|uniref:Uncharacterized protein n=1 Tax=Proteus mirabilis (strain HI4320) TaxID=529507 RepID=B4EUM7_PROMH|nr:hypothetical protein PMI0292 [Proteus mirabilis HI4320]
MIINCDLYLVMGTFPLDKKKDLDILKITLLL